MYLFVDALDECGERNAQNLLKSCQSLATASKLQGGALYICVSSRHYPVIETDISFVVLVDKKNTTDIEIYVTQKLASIRESGQEYEDLRSAIISRSGGVFQWTALVVSRVVSSLKRKQPFRSILEDVEKTPQQLYGLEDQIIRSYLAVNDCRNRDKDRVRRLFQWMSVAKRSLTLMEVRWAVEADPSHQYKSWQELTWHVNAQRESDVDGEDIQHLSCGLLCVEEVQGDLLSNVESEDRNPPDSDDDPALGDSTRTQERMVVFIHQSVYDYFRDSGLGLLHDCDPWLAICAAKLDVFTICHKVIRLACDNSATPPGFSLLYYSVVCLFNHARSVKADGNSQDRLIRVLDWPAQNCVAMLYRLCKGMKDSSALDWPKSVYQTESLVHVAAAFGMLPLLHYILQHSPGLRINVKDSQGLTPLHFAAGAGHIDVVFSLLDIKRSSRRRRRWASWVPGSKVLKIDIKDHEGMTPLWYSAASGSVAIVKRLIQAGKVDLECKALRTKMTPLLISIDYGHEGVAKVLITKGANIRARDSQGRYPIYLAAARGLFDLVLSLMPQAADELCAVPEMEVVSALYLIMKSNHAAIMVNRLLDKGLDPNKKDIQGRTWLSYAAECHVPREVIEQLHLIATIKSNNYPLRVLTI